MSLVRPLHFAAVLLSLALVENVAQCASPPVLGSLSPNASAGASQTFTLGVTDPDGFQDVAVASLLLNVAVDGRNACYVIYSRPLNALFLVNDAGSGSTRVDLGTAATTQNSQCILSAASSSVSGGGTAFALTIALTFKPAFGGVKAVFAAAQDNAGFTAPLSQLGTFSVSAVSTVPPAPSFVTPSGGAGGNQAFTFSLGDANGFGNIASATMLFNSVLDGSHACFIYFDRAQNAAFLINDAGSGSMRVDIGTAAVAQNSQCSLSGSGSSVSGSGTSLNVTLNISFAAGFAGFKFIYASAQNLGGLNSGLISVGTWNVTTGAVGPVVVSVTPSSGSGQGQIFTFVFSDANGYADIGSASVLVNSSLDGRSACYIVLSRATNTIYLVDDTSTFSTPLVLGSTGFVQNSQCSVQGSGSSSGGAGNDLTVALQILFKSAFAGSKAIYMSAQDNAGNTTGLRALGSYTVVGIGPQPPVAATVTPNSGVGFTQTFVFSFSDPNGAGNIGAVSMLFNSILDGANACFITYDRSQNAFFLINDAANGGTQVTIGSGAAASNSQCTLLGNGSFVSSFGNFLTVTLNLSFKPAFGGTKTIYMYAQNYFSLNSGLQSRGTWTIP